MIYISKLKSSVYMCESDWNYVMILNLVLHMWWL